MSDRTRSSEFDEFDTDEIRAAVQDVAGDGLRVFVEYDTETYNVLYLADRVETEFGGQANVTDVTDRLHADYRLDFTEKRMYEDVYAELGAVRAFGVFFEENALFRFVGERTGFYVSVDIDAPFERVIQTVYDVIDDGPEA